MAARILALLVLALLTSSAHAQGYPDKPIRILVGFAAGGPADIAARLIGDRLSEAWGKPVIVENVTGAAGNLATDRVAKSAPDGYTLLAAASATIVTNPSLYQKLPFDPVKDLAPITQICYTPNILAVHRRRAGEERGRSSSPMRGPIPASSPSARPASVPRSILPANCSRPWRASTSSTCRIAASRR